MGKYATLKIPVGDEDQREHIYKASEYLRKGGVTFDTGVNLIKNNFDWKFDWSLKGAEFDIESKELIFTGKMGEKRINNIRNADLELQSAGVKFLGGFNESRNTVVWNFSNAKGCEIVVRNDDILRFF